MSIGASKKGLNLIRERIAAKGWSPNSQRWVEKCEHQFKTWQRFITGQRIHSDTFEYFCKILDLKWEDVAKKPLRYDIDDALKTEKFLGRSKELDNLRQYVIERESKLLVLLGEGGIGKTSLAAEFIKDRFSSINNLFADRFDCIYWKNLRTKPPFATVLNDIIQFIVGEQEVSIPDAEQEKINQLISIFKKSSCLIILDNAESIRLPGNKQDEYENGYEKFEFFLTEIERINHHSCLLITSREDFGKVGTHDPNKAKTIRLSGLSAEDTKQIFAHVKSKRPLNQNFEGADEDWKIITNHYGGNPFILPQVASFLLDNYAGNISKFKSELEHGKFRVSTIDDVLDRQFERLSHDEKQVLYWLAIEQEAVSIPSVEKSVISNLKDKIQPAFQSLNKGRSLIQNTESGLHTLQPYFREYVTKRIIDKFVENILTQESIEQHNTFNTHPLIQAASKEYILESQNRLLLNPVLERLRDSLKTSQQCKERLKLVIQNLQTNIRMLGYAGGNIINLIVQLEKTEQNNPGLRNYDFSNLCLWEVDLRNINLYEVNFSNADFRDFVFTEPRSTVLSIAFSHKGKLFATGDGNNNIYISQIDYNKTVSLPPGHSSWVWSITFSPDDLMLASGGEDGKIILWELEEFENLQDLQSIKPNFLGQHEGRVWSVAFSPDGKMLASGGEDGKIFLWHICDQTKTYCVLGEHTNRVDSLVFDPSGNFLISVGSDGFIRVWNVANKTQISCFGDGLNRLRSVVFVESNMIVTGGDDGTVKIWNIESQQCLSETKNKQPKCIWSVAYNQKYKIIASSSDNGIIRLWNIDNNNQLNWLINLREHKDRVWSVVFNPANRALASTSEDQSVRVWNINENKKYQCERIFYGYSNWIHSIYFSPDGYRLASSSNDNKIRIWDIDKGICTLTLEGNIRWDSSIAFSPDGRYLASGSHDHLIHFWDLNQGTTLEPFKEHKNWVRSLAFSPDGRYLASGGDDTTIKVINAKTQALIYTLEGHQKWIWSVIFIDSKYIASCGDDQTIRIWDVKTRQCRELSGHTGRLRSLAYSNGILATGGEDKVVKLWNTETYEIYQNFPHTDSNFIWAVALSPDGETLASGDEKGILRLWDVGRQELVYEERLHENRIVRGITFHPTNSSVMATCGEDGKINLLNIENIESPAIRNLSINKPYEKTNIHGVTGLTQEQKNLLKALGAIDE